MLKIISAIAASLILFAGASNAAPVIVNEATMAGAGGDYNNLLSPPRAQAHIFDLNAGVNTFTGSIHTPGDQGDTMIIRLGAGEILTGISVRFHTNPNPFNPLAISQGTRFLLEKSSTNPLLVALNFPDIYSHHFSTITRSTAASISSGLYTITMLSGVLGLNSGGGVGYEISLTVDGPAVSVDEPAGLMLFGLGLVGAFAIRRRKQS